jgi:hypothetical protein
MDDYEYSLFKELVNHKRESMAGYLRRNAMEAAHKFQEKVTAKQGAPTL